MQSTVTAPEPAEKKVYSARSQRLPGTHRAVPEADRIRFDYQGFVILRGVLDAETVQALKDELARLEATPYDDSDWKHPDRGMPTKSSFGEALRLNGLPRLSSAFDILIGHEAVLPYLEEFVADPQLVNTWYINKQQGKGSVGWHSGLDAHEHHVQGGRSFAAMVNTIWALDPNNEETGCPIALPGSHKRSFDPEQRYHLLDMPGSVPVILEPGDVFLFSEATLHGGLPRSAPGSRRNCYINYVEGTRRCNGNDDGNLHHRWFPPEVRARFPEHKQRLLRWMETSVGA